MTASHGGGEQRHSDDPAGGTGSVGLGAVISSERGGLLRVRHRHLIHSSIGSSVARAIVATEVVGGRFSQSKHSPRRVR